MTDSQKNTQKKTVTRECLVLALQRLLGTKTLDDITVSELAKTAGISRTTFYRNYSSIIDVFTDHFMRYPFGAASPEEYTREGFDLRRRLLTSFRFLKENRKLINGMIKAKGAILIYENYVNLMKGLFRPRVAEMGFRSKYEQSAAAGLYFGICYDWIEGGMKESVEEMADISYRVLRRYHIDDGYVYRKDC